MIVKIVRLASNMKKSAPSNHVDVNIPDTQNRPFDQIQDAEFEDITPKTPQPPEK